MQQRQLAVAQDNVEAAKKTIVSDEADLELKQLEFDRAQNLWAKGAGTAETRDQASAALKQSNAALARDGALEANAEANVALAEANAQSAAASLGMADIVLGYTTLTAPFDGVILVRQAELGEVAAPGAPIVTMADIDHVWLPALRRMEPDIGKVRFGEAAVVTTDTYPGKKYQGRISLISSCRSSSTRRTTTPRVSGSATRKRSSPVFPAMSTRRLERQGAIAESAPAVVQSRVWFNEDLDSRNFVIPGVVAMVLALVGAQLTSLTISREWERGTMEVLISTPVTRMELMTGKLLPYFAIGLIDAALCLALAVFWFEVPFRGALATLFLTTSLFLVVVLGVGYLSPWRLQPGRRQPDRLAGHAAADFAALSGFAFPIDQMPWPIQAITYLVHSRYYVTILKAVFLKGTGLIELADAHLAARLYAAVIAFLAARAFRKTLD